MDVVVLQAPAGPHTPPFTKSVKGASIPTARREHQADLRRGSSRKIGGRRHGKVQGRAARMLRHDADVARGELGDVLEREMGEIDAYPAEAAQRAGGIGAPGAQRAVRLVAVRALVHGEHGERVGAKREGVREVETGVGAAGGDFDDLDGGGRGMLEDQGGESGDLREVLRLHFQGVVGRIGPRGVDGGVLGEEVGAGDAGRRRRGREAREKGGDGGRGRGGGRGWARERGREGVVDVVFVERGGDDGLVAFLNGAQRFG